MKRKTAHRLDRPHRWEFLNSGGDGPRVKWCSRCGANRCFGAVQTLDGKPGCVDYIRAVKRVEGRP